MSNFGEEFSGLFEINPRKKGNSTRKLKLSHVKAKAGRVAGGSAEVMVKITGYGKGAGHAEAHIKYISRNGKVELENERGEKISGIEDMKALASDWTADFADAKRHKNQRDTMHVFFSMPPGTPEEDVRIAARNFLRDKFSDNHEYVFALHTDQPHPHVHASVKMLGFDAKRLRVDRDDLQLWREEFAAHLRKLGVDAEATPRAVRGVTKRPESLIVKHIEAGDSTHPPRVPKVKASRVKEATDEILLENRGGKPSARPWEANIVARHDSVRAKWKNAAAALESLSKRKFNPGKLNDRPDYSRTRDSARRIQQRVAALYKPGAAQTQTGRPAAGGASLRVLPNVNVVHHRELSESVLQSNSYDSLGANRGANSSLRRKGLVTYANAERSGGGNSKRDEGLDQTKKQKQGHGLIATDEQLSKAMLRFADNLPAPRTLMQETKARLKAQFTSTVQIAPASSMVPARQRPGADLSPTPTPTKKRDIER